MPSNRDVSKKSRSPAHSRRPEERRRADADYEAPKRHRSKKRRRRRRGHRWIIWVILLLLLLAIQQINRAKRLLAAGELSETLRLPYPWLMYLCAGGLFLLACAYLTDCVYLLTRKDPDTEALASVGRQGVVTSIRNDVVLPAGKEATK